MANETLKALKIAVLQLCMAEMKHQQSKANWPSTESQYGAVNLMIDGARQEEQDAEYELERAARAYVLSLEEEG